MVGEVVLVKKSLNIDSTPYFRKQITQLYSKSRYVAAQFEAYFKDDLWLRLARHANKMAKYLEERVKNIPEIKISSPVETNVVFAIIDQDLYDKLRQKHYFYIWDEERMEVRWMTSFKTTEEDIDNFINDIIS